MSPKERIDLLVVELGLAETRTRAQALILAGNVLVNDVPITKVGQKVERSAEIRTRGSEHPYVSRGGLKLKEALDVFHVSVNDRLALDVGASTGGFTDVLLQGGARKVHALDVGHSQMDWKIRSNPRVVVYEGINARHLTFSTIGEKVDVITIDVSFISLSKILPPLRVFSHPTTDWITLIKPQFEVGPERVGKGGIVKDEGDQKMAVEEVTRSAESLGLKRLGLIESPITGTSGNREYLAHWKMEFESLS